MAEVVDGTRRFVFLAGVEKPEDMDPRENSGFPTDCAMDRSGIELRALDIAPDVLRGRCRPSWEGRNQAPATVRFKMDSVTGSL